MLEELFGVSKVGIDLGTTSVLVYVPGKGVVTYEPSVVAVSDDQQILAVGDEAKRMIGRTPEHIRAYRPMKDGVIADYRVTEAMLRYFLRQACGRFSLRRPDVLVSVPSGVSSTEKRAVIEAALNAGAKNAYVLKEPILAALGAGLPIYEPCGHLIVDIGGGTTDAAVISLGSIVAATSVRCAGNKIDATIVDYVKKTYNLAIGEKTAEDIKIGIGSALPVEEELSMEVKGRDLMSGLPRTIELKTNEVVRATQKELREIVGAIKTVFQDTPPELAADIIDYGIILTGGSSQLRNLAEFVKRRTGVKTKVAEQAQFCVVKGTGIALQHLDMYKQALIRK
ncbi:rod shape-determining protein [Candidatus Kaiserbacteria bacterium RIFCSPHIGHO2_02_FULL_50_50]|uniref:Cell shape-determining protein MreB n=1 Tax=Candidatus Kaiserbacteria bacterium RIFCSPHIGHO2_02_FULL_50_50 TaxID=1798492 RepID=A0A1F6DEW7_9BACT|nr:MAG: rod shape-determining protein [Candidatus Kaiserbacteria bacterium RIFCSPHIGHO2_02_FULL_50_50]OGG89221.1 MAG: rod shape-determining protein [Candidatus Kaiserbacteria bacterium RIFCSPLOWO2_12_FULL_50_10]